MSTTPPIDYNALAKQAGAINSVASGAVDYAALAKQAGAINSAPAADKTVSQPSFFDKVGVDVAKGMGLDTDALLAAHKTNGVTGQLLELGSQLAKGAGNFALSVARDPFNVVKPIDAMASGVTKAAGLPDSSSQSLSDPNSYHAPNPGQLVGSLAKVAAGVEAPDAASAVNDATAGARNAIAEKVVSPLVAKPAAQTAADLAAGRNPAGALVSEGLVGTKKSLVTKADARLGEISQQTEAALKNSPNANVQLDAAPIIDGAVKAAQDAAAKSGNQAVITRLSSLKDALTTQYGSLQGNPLAIQRLKQAIGDTASDLGSFKNTDPLEASVAGALRDIYARLNDQINSAVPEASDLNERATNLIAAKSGLLRNVVKDSQSILDSHSATSALLKILKSTAASAPVLSGLAKLIGSTKE